VIDDGSPIFRQIAERIAAQILDGTLAAEAQVPPPNEFAAIHRINPATPAKRGSAPVDDRAVFTAIVFVLTSGCAWRHLPPCFGVTVPTAHRRFTTWSNPDYSSDSTGKYSTTSAVPVNSNGMLTGLVTPRIERSPVST